MASNRLPKQFWRVVVLATEKIGIYERGSKTYAAEHHAISAANGFNKAGIRAEVWTTGPVDWKCVSSVEPTGMEPLFDV
jgi:hypothetical protein